jgi:hypothetical protein
MLNVEISVSLGFSGTILFEWRFDEVWTFKGQFGNRVFGEKLQLNNSFLRSPLLLADPK